MKHEYDDYQIAEAGRAQLARRYLEERIKDA